jgi:diguanylate cyclase (GGDEF)-like protein/PAS domain S-box-containing protein/hemerythrin-like metal-binding protein
MNGPHTARKTAGRKIAATRKPGDEETFRAAFELAGIGMGLVNEEGRFVAVNGKLAEVFGIGKEELAGIRVDELPVPEGDTPARIPEQNLFSDEQPPAIFEKRFLTRQGSIVWTEFSFARLGKKAGGFVVSFHDITDRKLLQIALEQQASLDPLTRALNRVRFEESATIEMLRSGRAGYKMSLVMADMDHFKSINDTLGHAAGDAALKAFGEVARSCLRATDLFGRWGGEEFLMLLPDTGPAGAKRVAERIRARLEKFEFPRGMRVTVSLGVAGRRAGESFAAMLERADTAMYTAKGAGRNRVVADAEDLRREADRKTARAGILGLSWEGRDGKGAARVDAEHTPLFESANRLLAMMGEDEEGAHIIPQIDDVLAHVTEHLMREEQMLKASGLKEYEAHRRGHRALLAQASDLADRVRLKKATAGAFLGFVIHDVVARHIIETERKYGRRAGKAAAEDVKGTPGAGEKGRAGGPVGAA